MPRDSISPKPDCDAICLIMSIIALPFPNRNALIEMLQAGGFGAVMQVAPPFWAPAMYRDGRRVLLLAYKTEGPWDADDPAF